MNANDLTMMVREQMAQERARADRPAKGTYIIGVDLGQSHDFTAISILLKDGTAYQVVHLERLPLDMPYPKQVEYVYGIMHRKPLYESNVTLAIDYTAVGHPVLDMMDERGMQPVGISISGGNAVSWDPEWKKAVVPKKDLISAMQISAQNNRLKIPPNLKFGDELIRELENFKVKIDIRTAHDSYNAREGAYDDLILSLAIGLWTSENRYRDPNAKAPARFFSMGKRFRYSF